MITAEAIIHLPSIKTNYQKLKSICGSRPLVAVIKGDAYGHGATEVARALPDADMFAVARMEEALELRNAGITSEILLLEGCFCASDLIDAAENQLQVVIHHQSQLDQFVAAKLCQPIEVWLKVDTGMHRVGLSPEQIDSAVRKLRQCENLQGELHFLSHFSCADNRGDETTIEQIALFNTLTKPYAGKRSIANSAGLLFWPDSHFDCVRSGIALYGISPTEEETGNSLGLQPAMTLRTKLISVREHQASEPVGYSQQWRAPAKTKIGVIALGYGDGYPRLAPEGTPVWINGRVVPIVGRVSMDMITVDLGAASMDQVGDDVEMWGRRLAIEDVAKTIGTIPYELTIKLTRRVARTFVGQSE